MKIQLIDAEGVLVRSVLAAMPNSLDSGMRVQITDEVWRRSGEDVHPDALLFSMIGDAWARVAWDALTLKYVITVVGRDLAAAMNCWRAALLHVGVEVARVVAL